MATIDSRSLGPTEISYAWECPNKHLPIMRWTKNQLQKELDEGTLKLQCYCGENKAPSKEEEKKLRKLAE